MDKVNSIYIVLRESAYLKDRRERVLGLLVAPIGTVFCVVYFFNYGITYLDFCLFLLFSIISGLGITVGYHRFFSHRTFTTSSRIKAMLAMFAYTTGEGPVLNWVAHHRLHHKASDTVDDPHSPIDVDGKVTFKSFWHAHFGWILSRQRANPGRFCLDWLRDRELIRLDAKSNYFFYGAIVMPGVIAFLITFSVQAFLSAILYAGFFRLFLAQQGTFCVNSLFHCIGSQDYETADTSRNIWWLGLVTFGEAWHNNHHAHPNDARMGRGRFQFDIGYYFILLLEAMGLVKINSSTK